MSPYWFSYLYGVFWSWVAYCCATHTVAAGQNLFAMLAARTAILPQTKWETISSAVIWPVGVFLFGWAAYRLLTLKAGMKLIYILVCLHALNALFHSVIALAFWAILSAVTIWKFKELNKSPNPASIGV